MTAASKGLGRACATSLAGEGVEVWITARTKEMLEETAREIAESTGATVHAVPGDITTEEGRAAVLEACPEPDILVANPGVKQTPDDFRTMSRADWDFWMEGHFYSTLDLIRAVAPGMCERRFGRIVSMSVSFIKFPQVGFAASHSAHQPARARQTREHDLRSDRRRPQEGMPSGAVRRAVGVRRSRGLHLRRAVRIHERPEHHQRRRRLSGAF